MLTLAEAFVGGLAVGSRDASEAFLATADTGGGVGAEHLASRTHMLAKIQIRIGNRLKSPFPSMGYILPAGTPQEYSALVSCR